MVDGPPVVELLWDSDPSGRAEDVVAIAGRLQPHALTGVYQVPAGICSTTKNHLSIVPTVVVGNLESKLGFIICEKDEQHYSYCVPI